jgi:hypothetical protein
MSKPNHIVEPEELMAYLDGELPAEQALETAAHLEHCRECQKLAEEVKEISGMLVAWEVEETEAEPGAAIIKALDASASEKTFVNKQTPWRILLSPRNWPKVAWGLAAVGLVILVISTSNLGFKSSPSTFYRAQRGLQDEVRSPQPAPPKVPAPTMRARQASPSAPPVPKTGAIAGLEGDTGNYGTAGKLKSEIVNGESTDEQSDVEQEEAQESAVDNAVDLKSPMIIRTADLGVTVKEFDKARSAVDEILHRYHGHVGDLSVNTPAGSARSLTGTLRVPSNRLDAALADLKGLGRVEKESQNGEEVTQRYIDLQARLANAKHTEQRLTEILRERTGKLSDVLAVEIQISRVRGEIEQMQAQRKTMKNQVDFATLNLTVTEDYKKELTAAPPSTGTQFRNAAVDGYRSLVDGIIAVLLWLLSVGPTLLLWAAILFFPARMAWKRLRPRFAQKVE